MRKLLRDRSGAALPEFAVVGVMFFTLLIGIFDLGLYTLFRHSVGTLAATGSRQVIIQAGRSVADRTNPVAPAAAIQTACTNAAVATVLSSGSQYAPALFLGSGAVTLTAAMNGTVCRVTAQKTYNPVLPIWGGALMNPSQAAEMPST